MREAWIDILITSFRDVANRLAFVAPRVLAASALLLAGLVVAALARRLAVRLLRTVDFDGRCARWGLTVILGRHGIRRTPSETVGGFVFWTLFAVALLMGVEALDMPATARLAALAIRFLPNLLVAVLVLVIGWLLAHFLAEATLIAVVNAQVSGAPLIAALVRWLTLAAAAGVALTQLDIAREMVLLIFGIAFGGAVLALALAFGLGARELARDALQGWLRRPEGEESDRTSHV